MSEITIHTGVQGDHIGINIDWFDENNVRQEERLAIMIKEQDKPRTLEITINGVLVYRRIPSNAVSLLLPKLTEIKS